jgi:hypothetical protein
MLLFAHPMFYFRLGTRHLNKQLQEVLLVGVLGLEALTKRSSVMLLVEAWMR